MVVVQNPVYQGNLTNTFIADAVLKLPHVEFISEIKVIKYGEDAPPPPKSASNYNEQQPSRSGATIILATVVPNEYAAWDEDNYFIKVNVREQISDNKNRLKRLKFLLDTPQAGTVELTAFTEYKERIIEMTKAAFADVENLSDDIIPLTELIKYRTTLTQIYLKKLRDDILKQWAINDQPDRLTIGHILERVFEKEKLRGKTNKTIMYRAENLMESLQLEEDDRPLSELSLNANESNIVSADYIVFQATRHLQEDQTETLANPISYIAKQKWQLVHEESLPFVLAFSHYDFHCDNIICLLNNPSEESPTPRIIDLTDYKNNFSLYWDYLYLEFDLLQRIGQPKEVERRDGLRRLIRTLLHRDFDDPKKGPIYDDEIVYKTLYDHIMLLREGIIDVIKSDQRNVRLHKKAFFVIAMSVGLNYMRKMGLNTHVRLMALYYAAHALQSLLLLDDVKASTGNMFTVPPWTSLKDATDALSTGIHVEKLLKECERKSSLIICLGEKYNRVHPQKVRDKLVNRLELFANEDVDKIRDLSEAVQKFCSTFSELNLKLFAEKLYRENDYSAEITEELSIIEELFRENKQIHIITTDWYPLPWSTADDEKRIHHICGKIQSDDDLKTLEQLGKPPPIMQRLFKQSYTVFFGKQSIQYSQWIDYFGYVTDGMYVAQEIPIQGLNQQIRIISPSRSTRKDEIDVPSISKDFLETMRRHAKKMEFKKSFKLVKLSQAIDNYKPNALTQEDLLEEVLYSEPRKWIIINSPLGGKSTFLDMLVKAHIANSTPQNPKRGLVIDFDKYHTLREKKQAILCLLFDLFDISLDDFIQADSISVVAMVDYLKQRIPRHRGNFVKDIVGFDNLSYEDDNIGDWLRRVLVNELVDKGIQVIFTFRSFSDELGNKRTAIDFALWSGYEIRQLQAISIRHIKAIIKDYIDNVDWGRQRLAYLNENKEDWTYRQANCYQQLTQGNVALIYALVKEHLRDTRTPDELNLGNWPDEDQKIVIRERIVFNTIWTLLEKELELNPRNKWAYQGILSMRVLSAPLLQKLGSVIETYSKKRGSSQTFAPIQTIITQLRSNSYVRTDIRVNSSARHPDAQLLVSQEIYPVMMQYLLEQDKNNSLEENYLHKLYSVAYEYTQASLPSPQELNKTNYGDDERSVQWLYEMVDTLFNISVLYAIEQDTQALSQRIRKCRFPDSYSDKLREELNILSTSHQIDAVRKSLRYVGEQL